MKLVAFHSMGAKRLISNKFRLTSPVEPISQDDEDPSVSVYSQFRVLFRLCAASGIPLHLDRPEEGKCGVFALSVFGLANLLRVVNLVFVCRYASYLLTLNSLLMAFYAFHLSSMAVLGVVTVSRRDVREAALTIVRTVSRVNHSRKEEASRWSVTKLVVAYVAAVAGIAGSAFYAVYDVDKGELDLPPPLTLPGVTVEGEGILEGLKYAMTLAFLTSSATCGAFLVLAATAYHHLSEAVRQYGRKLRRRFELGGFGQGSVAENILAFQTVAGTVSRVDAALSAGVLFLYSAAVSCFFIATSVALFASEVTVSLHVFASVQFATALACFFLITITGGKVPARALELKHELVACSGRMAKDLPSVRELASFAVMAQDIRTADLYVTGGNMFVIRKDMILNVAGVMITYGVLIFQLDTHSSLVNSWNNMSKNGTFGT